MKAKDEVITQEHLKSLLEYDSKTGNFIWIAKASKYSNVVVGSIADKLHSKYKEVSIDNKRYKSHRLVWLYLYGRFPEQMIDHIDGDRYNNRASNLRLADASSNNWNRSLNSNSGTGIKGVRLHKNGNYEARVMYNKKSYYLGVFDDISNAEQAVKSKREELHKEFSNHGITV